MTRTTNARIAGFTFLFYIAAGITSMSLFARATSGEGIAAKLAGIVRHETEIGIVLVLLLLESFSAIVLGVTLWAITREQDSHLAMLAMICRVGEGVISAAAISRTKALVGLATLSGGNALDNGAREALGTYLMSEGFAVTATFFAVGSTLFCYLLLRGRMIPTPMAWLGLVASLLLVLFLPMQLAGVHLGAFGQLIWLPMLLFEVPFAFWLLVKGVASPAASRAAEGSAPI